MHEYPGLVVQHAEGLREPEGYARAEELAWVRELLVEDWGGEDVGGRWASPDVGVGGGFDFERVLDVAGEGMGRVEVEGSSVCVENGHFDGFSWGI